MEPEMVGRADEVGRLITLATAGASVLVTGDAGVGKSALLRRVADRLTPEHTVWTVWGTAPAKGIPFAAVAHLVDGVAAIDQAVLINQLAVRMAAATPAVVAVDDIDQVDEATLAVLDRLARTDGVAVIATRRTQASAAAETTPPTLSWADAAARLDLPPLDREATTELGAHLLDGPLSVGLAAALWDKTQGNPLLVTEVLLSSEAAGVLRRGPHQWDLAADLVAGARVTDLVKRRLDGLDADHRRCMNLVAVAEPLPLARLADVFPATVFAELERRSLLRADQAGGTPTLRLAHPILGDVLRDGLGPLGRRAVLLELAECHDAATVGDGESLRLASWLLDLGETADPALLRRGAAEALDRFEPVLAERLLRALDPTADPALSTMLGSALRAQGRLDEALPLLTAAVEQAATPPDVLQAVGALADTHLFDLGDVGQALTLLGEGVDRLTAAGAPPEASAQLRTRAFLATGMAGDFATVLAEGQQLLQLPLPPPVEGSVLMAYTLAQAMTGRLDDVLDGLDRAERLALADGGSNPVLLHQLQLNRTLVLHSLAGLDAAAAHTAGMRAATAEPLRASALFVDSLVLLLAGDLDGVLRHTAEALADLEQGDPLGLMTLARTYQAVALAMSGRRTEAVRAVTGLATAAHLDEPRMDVWRQQAEAWIEAGGGKGDSATRRLVEAGSRAVDGQHAVWGAQCLHAAVRLGHPGPVVEPLAALARSAGPLVELFARHADAAAAADPVLLDKVADDLLATGAVGVAVDAWAACADAEDDEAAAARAALLAHLAMDRCSGYRSPLLDRVAHPLTPRQHEVAVRAAAGTSARAIAQELTVTAKTVDNHLQGVYLALGLQSRSELTALWHRVAPTRTAPGVET
ncbi:MAG: AAA family ATPase [Actinomycetota bacterium]